MNKTDLQIKNCAKKYGVPHEILRGIYVLETTYRVWFHRLAENILVTVSLFAHIILRTRVRNFTIGRCQVGLSTILICAGRSAYRHSKHLDDLSLQDCKLIFQAMRKEKSIDVCAQYISSIYGNYVALYGKGCSLICRIGELYNGSFTYGLMLEKQVHLYDTDRLLV